MKRQTMRQELDQFKKELEGFLQEQTDELEDWYGRQTTAITKMRELFESLAQQRTRDFKKFADAVERDTFKLATNTTLAAQDIHQLLHVFIEDCRAERRGYDAALRAREDGEDGD